MANLVDRDRVKEFFRGLSQKIRSDVTVYLTGGSFVIYHGIRPATTDIDFGYDAEDPVDREALPELAQRAAGSDFRVECSEGISGGSLMPLPGYRERAIILERFGCLVLKSVHTADLILAKVHRGYAEDLSDAKAIADHFHIPAEEIVERFNEIFTIYPASTGKTDLRQGFDRFLKLLQDKT